MTTHLNAENSHSTLYLPGSALVSELFTLRDYLRWVSSEFY
ncbi:MAG: 50S ribosomal protein L3 N(5)-glutamine methyltransferase, partial [Halomonadaceae bacterium]